MQRYIEFTFNSSNIDKLLIFFSKQALDDHLEGTRLLTTSDSMKISSCKQLYIQNYIFEQLYIQNDLFKTGFTCGEYRSILKKSIKFYHDIIRWLTFLFRNDKYAILFHSLPDDFMTNKSYLNQRFAELIFSSHVQIFLNPREFWSHEFGSSYYSTMYSFLLNISLDDFNIIISIFDKSKKLSPGGSFGGACFFRCDDRFPLSRFHSDESGQFKSNVVINVDSCFYSINSEGQLVFNKNLINSLEGFSVKNAVLVTEKPMTCRNYNILSSAKGYMRQHGIVTLMVVSPSDLYVFYRKAVKDYFKDLSSLEVKHESTDKSKFELIETIKYFCLATFRKPILGQSYYYSIKEDGFDEDGYYYFSGKDGFDEDGGLCRMADITRSIYFNEIYPSLRLMLVSLILKE